MIGSFIDFIKTMYYRLLDDDILALGAQMAYYLILSFFPFLIFLMALIGHSPVSSQQVLRGLLGILPEQAYNLVNDTVVEIVDRKTGGLAPISGILALWFASNGIGSIITGLNKAYDEKEKRPFWMVKLISIIFTLLLSIVIIFSFILLIFGGVIKKQILDGMELDPFYQNLWNTGRYIFISSAVFLVFIILYRFIPSRCMRLTEVVPGAVFATLGWLLTSLGFAYYVDNFSNYSRFYGSIGGVVILLIWLYYSAVIILLGGELNAALAYEKKLNNKRESK
ncbi:MAG: YihY/virulence factor BrkB family protein [Caldicoprobacterales bacterium]|nr:YihY/virulence factor BrkB family protein [Clostridiales bacterium]